jgi:hypothetical protein
LGKAAVPGTKLLGMVAGLGTADAEGMVVVQGKLGTRFQGLLDKMVQISPGLLTFARAKIKALQH